MQNKIIFKFIYYSSTLSLRIASEISLFFFSSFFIIESCCSNRNERFRMIFAVNDKLMSILNERIIKYVNGIYLSTI